MNGNLSSFFAGGAQPAASGLGLFDAFSGAAAAPAAPAAAAAPQSGVQMAMRLSQSPTPETAQQIIQQLHQMKSPEAAQFEQLLTNVMNNPQALKQLADAVMQKLGGANA